MWHFHETRWLTTLLHVAFLIAFLAVCSDAKAGDDSGDLLPVTLRYATTGEPVFGVQSFQPRDNLTYCSVYSKAVYSKKNASMLDCTTVYHQKYQYVDLEQLEPLLEDQRVLCDETAALHRPTEVVLRFVKRDALRLAQYVWGRGEGFIFMIEDPHCFHPNGDRSFYLSDYIEWDEHNAVAIIHATPLFADVSVENSEWAHKSSRGMKRVPAGYFPHVRPSTGLQSYLNPEYLALYDEAAILKRRGAKEMAIVGCVAGLLTGSIPACILGAPYYALLTEILDADKASPHLKIGAGIGMLSPVIGTAIMGIGTLIAPTEIYWKKHWNHDWGNRAIMFPWFKEKDVTTADHVKMPHITLRCPGCHVFGDFQAGLKIDFDWLGKKHKGPPECKNSENDHPRRPKRDAESRTRVTHDVYMELHRRAMHARRAQDVHVVRMKRDSEEEMKRLHRRRWTRTANHDRHFKRTKCQVEDATFPSCNLEEVERYHTKCDPYLDNLLLHPARVLGESFKCLFESVAGKTECWEKFHEQADHFDGFDDFLKKIVQRHLEAAKFTLDIDKKIDINLQGQIEFDITAGVWLDVDFGIENLKKLGLPVVSWGFLTSFGAGNQIIGGGTHAKWVNEQTSSHYDPKKPDNKGDPKKGWSSASSNGLGKMTWGLPVIRLEIVHAAHFAANFSLPGLSIEMDKGKFEIDLTKTSGQMVTSTVPLKLKYKGAKIDIGKEPFIQSTISLGFAFDVSLIPTNHDNVADFKWSDKHTHLMPPFGFGGAWDIVRFDLKIGDAAADNAECKEEYGDQWNTDGWMIAFYFRHGAKLYASIFGLRIDTSWMGKIQKDTTYAIDGFYWSKRLALKCIPFGPDHKEPHEWLSEQLNKEFDMLQEPIAKAFQFVEDTINRLGSDSYLPPDQEWVMGHKLPKENRYLVWEAYVRRYGLQRVKDTEIYTPNALPEPIAQCLAVEALGNKYHGTHSNCSALDRAPPKDGGTYDDQNAALQASVNNAMTCRLYGCPKKKPPKSGN